MPLLSQSLGWHWNPPARHCLLGSTQATAANIASAQRYASVHTGNPLRPDVTHAGWPDTGHAL